jgi:hypothetical protein
MIYSTQLKRSQSTPISLESSPITPIPILTQSKSESIKSESIKLESIKSIQQKEQKEQKEQIQSTKPIQKEQTQPIPIHNKHLISNMVYSPTIGKIRFVINGRYIVLNEIEIVLKTNEVSKLKPKTVLTVNRFENEIPIVRWMDFDLKKFVEIEVNEFISENLNNIL